MENFRYFGHQLDVAGTVYAVVGSSGSVGDGRLDHPAMRTGLRQLGSMVLDIDGDRLDAVFLDGAGLVRDRFSLIKTLD